MSNNNPIMKTQTLPPGTKIYTTKPKSNEKADWTVDARSKRKWGISGTIIGDHNSHGLYYDILHDDKTEASYEPSEFVVINEIDELEASWALKMIQARYGGLKIQEDGSVTDALGGKAPLENFKPESCTSTSLDPNPTLTIGGAQTSKLSGRFDLLPFDGLLAAARRFEYGATKYAEWQWAAATDEKFAEDRVNHLVRHCILFAQYRRREDLEALLCNGMMAAFFKNQNNWLQDRDVATRKDIE